MLKKMIMFAAVAGLVLALAPAAQAAELYREDWRCVDNHSGWGPIGPYMKGDNSGNINGVAENANPGWHTEGPPAVDWKALQAQRTCAVSNAWEDLVALPGPDGWRANVGGGESSGLFMWAEPDKGHTLPTVAAGDRVGTKFSLDYSYSFDAYSTGLRFVAEVGDSWYVTDKFGLEVIVYMFPGGSRHPCRVLEWVSYTADVETDNWYLWDDTGIGDDSDPTNGYDNPRPGGGTTPRTIPGISGTPIAGLPGGDIDRVGLLFEKSLNGHVWALDNFVVTPEPATLALLAFGGLGVLLRRRRRA